MTPKEARILGYTAFAFGTAFGCVNCPWISLILLIGVALPCLAYVIYDDFTGGDGGPLSPA